MGGKKDATKTKGIAKNKKIKKKIVDTFIKKEWYDVRAPAVFQVREIAKTLVNKTAGNHIAADSLVGRVFEVSQGDLVKDAEDDSYRVFKLRVEDVQGQLCLTNFYGMRLTTDKLKSITRKWHTLVEASVDVKTAEGYVLRVFAIAFTKHLQNSNKKTCYALSSQVRALRKRMVEVLSKEVAGRDLRELITKLMSESIGKEIEKSCQSIYPLQNCFIRQIKTLKTPKLDIAKLMEMHGGAAAVTAAQKEADKGEAVVREVVEEVEVEAE